METKKTQVTEDTNDEEENKNSVKSKYSLPLLFSTKNNDENKSEKIRRKTTNVKKNDRKGNQNNKFHSYTNEYHHDHIGKTLSKDSLNGYKNEEGGRGGGEKVKLPDLGKEKNLKNEETGETDEELSDDGGKILENEKNSEANNSNSIPNNSNICNNNTTSNNQANNSNSNSNNNNINNNINNNSNNNNSNSNNNNNNNSNSNSNNNNNLSNNYQIDKKISVYTFFNSINPNISMVETLNLQENVIDLSSLSESGGGITFFIKPNRFVPNLAKEDPLKCTIDLNQTKITGRGSFGMVFVCRTLERGEIMAVKKVMQDPRFKNRELSTTLLLQGHSCIVSLHHHFLTRENTKFFQSDLQNDRFPVKRTFFSTKFQKDSKIDKLLPDSISSNKGNPNNTNNNSLVSNSSQNDGVFLNLVMEYLPSTVFQEISNAHKESRYISMTYVKLYSFQLLRALNYLHSKSVCHRDVKPQNLLVDPQTGNLRLCDFGSAKKLRKDMENVAYICSRFYRAPELIFGESFYTCQVDMWSAGCVIAEMIYGEPLFTGKTSVDQLVRIIKVIGTPSPQEVRAMNPRSKDMKFPLVKPCKWANFFKKRIAFGDFDYQALDLVDQILKYDPIQRITPLQAMLHPFFDDIRKFGAKLPNSREFPHPQLFFFKREELFSSSNIEADHLKLDPIWIRDLYFTKSKSDVGVPEKKEEKKEEIEKNEKTEKKETQENEKNVKNEKLEIEVEKKEELKKEIKNEDFEIKNESFRKEPSTSEVNSIKMNKNNNNNISNNSNAKFFIIEELEDENFDEEEDQ